MPVPQEPSVPKALELVQQTMPPARLVLTVESWNDVVRLVETPPEPTEDLRRLFDDER